MSSVVIRYHSLSLVVPLVVNRCQSLSLDVSLVFLFINDPLKRLKGKKDLKGSYKVFFEYSQKYLKVACLNKCLVFLKNVLSKYQFGFQKGYSVQQCLLALLEKWRRAIDRGQMFGALLTDLPKTTDCLDHELLITKFNACGFYLPALKLVHDYLSNRKQRTKINRTYSFWL